MLPTCNLQIRVRYAETDPMGLLHHSRYLVYFEMGRTELLRLAGMDYKWCEQQGIFFVVARINVRYKAPARYDDLLTLTTTATTISPAKIEHDYFLRRDNQLLCQAQSTIACIDRQGRLQPVPEFLRNPSS